ncbi:MAG: AI-2E family transporter [Patescibacteria group bacterium]|jgi:predicted PurR-regulated permease PerM
MALKKEAATSARKFSISITPGSIFTFFVIAGLIGLVFYLRSLIPVFLCVVYLAALIHPFSNWGARFHLPKGVSVGLLYIGAAIVLGGVVVTILPTLIDQIQMALANYPTIINGFFGNDPLIRSMVSGSWFDQDLDEMILSIQRSGLKESLPQIVTGITSAFGGIVTGLLILILAFYLVIDGNSLKQKLGAFLSPSSRSFLFELIPVVREKIGLWLRGQLIIMVTMFTVTYVALSILGVPYALLLAILTGLLEVIPFLGPIIAAVPAILLALTVSPVMAVCVAILYFVMEQIEGDVLTPNIMQRVIGVNPVITIGSLLVGYELGGVICALLAIPTALVIGVSLEEWRNMKSKKRSYARTTS